MITKPPVLIAKGNGVWVGDDFDAHLNIEDEICAVEILGLRLLQIGK